MDTRRGLILIALLTFISVVGAGCNDGSDPSKIEVTAAELEAYRVACMDRINEYRATLDLPPYARWENGEACADLAAEKDARKKEPHSAFEFCDEWAQNECPGWQSVDRVLNSCFEMMWDEGPGEEYSEHGHYLAMTNENYTQLACGFYFTESGEVWAVQNFQ